MNIDGYNNNKWMFDWFQNPLQYNNINKYNINNNNNELDLSVDIEKSISGSLSIDTGDNLVDKEVIVIIFIIIVVVVVITVNNIISIISIIIVIITTILKQHDRNCQYHYY